MAAAWEMGFGKDVKKKLREIAWAVGVGLLRWLLEYLLKNGNTGGDDDANRK